jgi:hypothetical protein
MWDVSAKLLSELLASSLSGMLLLGSTTAVLLISPVDSGAIMLSVMVTLFEAGVVLGPNPGIVPPLQSTTLEPSMVQVKPPVVV